MSTPRKKNLLEVIQATTIFFQKHGIENPRLTIEWMLAHILKKKRLHLYLEFDRVLDESILETLREMVRRRISGEPLQYILGVTEFYGLEFMTDRRALIPRAETELLVEEVIAACTKTDPVKILDLGTGTGCIAITLASHLPAATVWATDLSREALDLAQSNAVKLGVAQRIHFLQSDLFSGLNDQGFDWIAANPPYVSVSDASSLAREIVEHEPHQALFGGKDGLAVIRKIVGEVAQYLADEGRVILEVGDSQSQTVQSFFQDAHYQIAKVRQDHQNRERFIIAQRVAKHG